MPARSDPLFVRRRLLLAGAGAAACLFARPRDAEAAASAQAPKGFAAAELKQAAERAELCSASNAIGTGLRGEYSSQDPMRGAPLLVRIDSTIDFDASLEWPAHLAGRRPQSVRWAGWVKAPMSGPYRFHVDQASARLEIARKVFAGEGAAAGTVLDMSAGRFYPVALEVKRLDRLSGRLQLEWTTPFGARYVVPRALLFIPGDGQLARS